MLAGSAILVGTGTQDTFLRFRPCTTAINRLIRQANRAFENYLDYLGQKQFDSASASLKELQETLDRLLNQSGAATGGQ